MLTTRHAAQGRQWRMARYTPPMASVSERWACLHSRATLHLPPHRCPLHPLTIEPPVPQVATDTQTSILPRSSTSTHQVLPLAVRPRWQWAPTHLHRLTPVNAGRTNLCLVNHARGADESAASRFCYHARTLLQDESLLGPHCSLSRPAQGEASAQELLQWSLRDHLCRAGGMPSQPTHCACSSSRHAPAPLLECLLLCCEHTACYWSHSLCVTSSQRNTSWHI
jgi:hypothetical protein